MKNLGILDCSYGICSKNPPSNKLPATTPLFLFDLFLGSEHGSHLHEARMLSAACVQSIVVVDILYNYGVKGVIRSSKIHFLGVFKGAYMPWRSATSECFTISAQAPEEVQAQAWSFSAPQTYVVLVLGHPPATPPMVFCTTWSKTLVYLGYFSSKYQENCWKAFNRKTKKCAHTLLASPPELVGPYRIDRHSVLWRSLFVVSPWRARWTKLGEKSTTLIAKQPSNVITEENV